MRNLWWLGLGLGLVSGLWAIPAGADDGIAAAEGGNYLARFGANDAPVAGRFTIHAYMLDSLDTVVDAPDSGRVVALCFRDANGDDSFIVPGDLWARDSRKREWRYGFLPLGPGRLDGHLAKGEARWALWWIPSAADTFVWEKGLELGVHYGFGKSLFYEMDKGQLRGALRAIPWDLVRGARIEADRWVGEPAPYHPASFDVQPRVLERVEPVYPKEALMYRYSGKVYTVVTVDEAGDVVDAYVYRTTAPHMLNVAALGTVTNWKFDPGKKHGQPVTGEMLVPVTYSLGGDR